MSMDKLKSLRQAKVKLENEYRMELQKKVIRALQDVVIDYSEGKSLPELAKEALEKQYVSQKELKLIYSCICAIRKNTDTCLAYRNGTYGWAHEKVTIDNYRLNGADNGLKKWKYNVLAIKKNYEVEGIKENPLIPLQEKCKQFGLKMLDYIG